MKKMFKASLVAAFVFFAASAVSGQGNSKPNSQKGRKPPASSSAAATAARVPVVIVGSAAKLTWATTKFTAKHFAAPVAKTVFLKAVPSLTRLALTHGVPLAAKLSMF